MTTTWLDRCEVIILIVLMQKFHDSGAARVAGSTIRKLAKRPSQSVLELGKNLRSGFCHQNSVF